MWIRQRDINGNWGYYNLETGEFRSAIPNSEEEKQQEQYKRNQAVLKTHSAAQAKFERTEGKLRNHSDETIKKKIHIPIVVIDANGNCYNKTYETLAPGEDSVQLNTFWEEQFPLIKGMQLVGGLTKLALSKTGSNSAAHWARNSLLNEEFKPIYNGFVRGSNPIIYKNVSETFANKWLSNAPSSISTPISPLKRSIKIVKNNGRRIINKVETPVKFPEGKAVIEGKYNTPIWIDSSGKKYYTDSGIKREPYDLSSSNVFKITSPGNKDIQIGVQKAFFPEDQLIHYSKDLMPIKNGKFQPISPKSGDFKAIWWERNRPATQNRRTTFTKVKDDPNTHIANKTRFGDDQTITTGEYPITSAESITPNPYTGFWDKVIYASPSISENGTRTSLKFFERPSKLLSEAEKLGVNKADRHNFNESLQHTFIEPYLNNLGEYDLKTNLVNNPIFGKRLGEGSEQIVYENTSQPSRVLKIYNDIGHSNYNGLRKFVKNYQKRNNVPFQFPTTFEGFVTNNNKMYPVFSQQYAKPISKAEFSDAIETLRTQLQGYSESTPEVFERQGRKILDLSPDNISKFKNKYYFIDAYPEGFKQGGRLQKI